MHKKHSFSIFNFQFSIVMRKDERYNQRGVSASKEDVHNAIKNIDKGIFPKAFCKIIPDYLGGQKSYCNIMHADGAGTKSSLAYMYWKETGDLSVWKGIAQDALIMNIDDLLCVGAVDNILLSSTIGRNKKLIPGRSNCRHYQWDGRADRGIPEIRCQYLFYRGRNRRCRRPCKNYYRGFYCNLPDETLRCDLKRPDQSGRCNRWTFIIRASLLRDRIQWWNGFQWPDLCPTRRICQVLGRKVPRKL